MTNFDYVMEEIKKIKKPEDFLKFGDGIFGLEMYCNNCKYNGIIDEDIHNCDRAFVEWAKEERK